MSLDLFGEEVYEQPELSEDCLLSVLRQYFIGQSVEKVASLLITEIDAIVEFQALCKGLKAGNRISLLFNPHRLAISNGNSPSVIEALNTEKGLKGLARILIWKFGKVKDVLYYSIELGFNGSQYANEFHPAIARRLYLNHYRKNMTILDPCAGWGGRMIGAASIGAHYVGYEPSTKTYVGLMRLAEWLRFFNTGFSFDIRNQPFEDAELDGLSSDIVLTSPPYYDTERYSAEETNSCNRYNNFTDWCEGFYKTMITRSIDTLRSGCYAYFNVGDRRYPLSDVLCSIVKAESVGLEMSSGEGMRLSTGGESLWRVVKL